MYSLAVISSIWFRNPSCITFVRRVTVDSVSLPTPEFDTVRFANKAFTEDLRSSNCAFFSARPIDFAGRRRKLQGGQAGRSGIASDLAQLLGGERVTAFASTVLSPQEPFVPICLGGVIIVAKVLALCRLDIDRGLGSIPDGLTCAANNSSGARWAASPIGVDPPKW